MVDQQTSLIDEINKQISEFKINKDKKDEGGLKFFLIRVLIVSSIDNQFWSPFSTRNVRRVYFR